MKICLMHNAYRKHSGEEAVVADQQALLTERGHEVTEFRRSSAVLEQVRWGKLKAFTGGIHNNRSVRALRRLLRQDRPDAVHVHNVFPVISPSVLAVCRQQGIPVVMSVHNFRLMCPTGLSVRGGSLCQQCWGGREWWCVIRNCENDLLRSGAYALRNWVARIRGAFLRNVTIYAPLTRFHRNRLIEAGLPAERMFVLHNMGPVVDPTNSMCEGDYVAYAGRITPAKGIEVLLQAAAQLPEVPFRLAGAMDDIPDLMDRLPANVRYVGRLPREKMHEFLVGSRLVTLPSTWPEGFPVVMLEAMAVARPVVASRTGGLHEIVEHGKTGLLVEKENPRPLREAIARLWNQPELCRSMGQAGMRRLQRHFSRERHYDRLISVYAKAIALGPGGPGSTRQRTMSGAPEAVDGR